jgi:hypothetical protein
MDAFGWGWLYIEHIQEKAGQRNSGCLMIGHEREVLRLNALEFVRYYAKR